MHTVGLKNVNVTCCAYGCDRLAVGTLSDIFQHKEAAAEGDPGRLTLSWGVVFVNGLNLSDGAAVSVS